MGSGLMGSGLIRSRLEDADRSGEFRRELRVKQVQPRRGRHRANDPLGELEIRLETFTHRLGCQDAVAASVCPVAQVDMRNERAEGTRRDGMSGPKACV